MINILKLSFFLLLAFSCQALDEESAKETQCFAIAETRTTKLNLEWLENKFYFPMMSRLDLYRVAQDFLQKDMKHITEPELYYESCFETSFNPKDLTFTSHGFNGKELKTTIRLLDPGMQRFNFTSPDGTGYFGTCYTTLTDLKSYLFVACCTNDNQMTWEVISTQKRLPKETVEFIHNHAESLGFQKEYFTGLRYDSCPSKQSEEAVVEKIEDMPQNSA